MSEQLSFMQIEKVKPKIDKDKTNWFKAYKKWINEMMDISTEHYGKCGYGSMCDFCEEPNDIACVKALKSYLKTEEIKIDYSVENFKEVWNGKT